MLTIRNVALCGAILAVGSASAQLRWQTRTTPPWSIEGLGPVALVAQTRNPPGLLAFVSFLSVSPRTTETWQFTNGVWSRLAPSRQPDPRAFASMAYDRGRDEVVLFGGVVLSSGAPRIGETWIWDGSDWIDRTPAVVPRGTPVSMAYGGGRLVLYTFADGGQTWFWDGSAWTLMASDPGNSPAPRTFAVLAPAPRDQVVMFGGADPLGPSDETLILDASLQRWRRVLTTVRPPSRTQHVMVYDADRQRVVLHGGRRDNVVLSDTWEFDGEQWYEIAPAQAGPALYDHVAAYEPARREVVVLRGLVSPTRASFGQFDYGPTARPGIRDLGSARCGFLSVDFTTAPILGGQLRILPALHPGGGVPDVALFSASLLGAPIRLQNCEFWLAAPLAPVPQDPGTGQNRITVPIPMDPALRGAVLYLQVAGPRRTGFEGFGLSSVYELTIGD